MTTHQNCPHSNLWNLQICSVQFSSVAQSCLTLCDPMNCSTPGLPVHHQLPESTQTRVHWVGDAIQPSHHLSSPSPPALNLSQHQGLFKWVSSSHQVAKVLEFQLQHQSFQWTPRTPLGWTGWISLQSKGLSRVFCNTTAKLLLHTKKEMLNCQSRFDARYWMLGAGALGRPRGIEWGGRREEGSGWGTHVYLWRIHFDIWQNLYNYVKFKKKKCWQMWLKIWAG